MKSQIFAAVLAACASSGTALGQTSAAAPPPPAKTVPALDAETAVLVCVGCEGRFETATHEELLEGLARNEFIGELRKALYFQDTLLQFSSKAHFDNCDFDGSITYLRSLVDEVGAAAAGAQAAADRKDGDLVHSEVRKAFYAIGQALHGIQDFYAHTNYVELSASRAARLDDLPLLKPWVESDQARIRDLQAQGLVSGFVFWGFPQKCPSGVPSHAELAKDSASTASGRKPVPNLGGRTQYAVAVHLAKKTSVAFITEAFAKWPILKDINGERVAFEVLVDRRGF